MCMIMYTSGTTGHPKGAMLTHGNLTWNCYNLLVDLDLAGDEVALVSAPLFHTAALNHTALPVFLKGGTNVLVGAGSTRRELLRPDRRAPDHADLRGAGDVPADRAVPAVGRRRTCRRCASCICGGAPVPSALIRTYQERGLTFVQGFGMTEASPGALLLRAGGQRAQGRLGRHAACSSPTCGSSGPDGTRRRAVGEPGEVDRARARTSWPATGSGPTRPPQALDGGWLHSGDVATVDEEGYVTIVDRIKDMIISGGENIYPAEVEAVLYEHPGVAECAVVGVPDERWGEVGRALVVLRDGAAATPEEILGFLDGRLARYKIPRTVVVVDTLARNASGKLLRRTLREQAAGAGDPVPERSPDGQAGILPTTSSSTPYPESRRLAQPQPSPSVRRCVCRRRRLDAYLVA